MVARASVLALFAKKAAFLRTPKTSERTRWWEALRANWAGQSVALALQHAVDHAVRHDLAQLIGVRDPRLRPPA